jgi:radical SAM superfamily enzyme YgiQ (UPF0313 family)
LGIGSLNGRVFVLGGFAMRILLISPRSEYPDVTPGWLRIPQMSLLILAALTPSEHQVVAVEEEIEPVLVNGNWDLVGITVMTATATRAYSLADEFRRRGSKVVLGGIHASVIPEEAAAHADAVLVGEAEGAWGRILQDAQNNNLQQIYRNSQPNINEMPFVHYNNHKRRVFAPSTVPVVASRGCPHACEFCCVHRVYGRRLRQLPVDRVLEQIRHSSANWVVFLDDNLGVNREWALELFAGLRPFDLKFLAQVSVGFVLDDTLFDEAVTAGLKGVFVGVETIDENGLANFRKSVPLEGYVEAINRCRAAGVLFHAALIFGMDEHDKSIFSRTLDFIKKYKVPSVSSYVMTPYPGTPLFDRMIDEGRLLHQDWQFYDHVTPVFRPALMNLRDLAEGYMQFRRELLSLRGILSRLPSQIRRHPFSYLGLSMGLRRTSILLREHYKRYFSWLEYNRLSP